MDTGKTRVVIAGGGTAVLPQRDGPSQQRNGQRDGNGGVGEPEFLEIAKTSSARAQLAADGRNHHDPRARLQCEHQPAARNRFSSPEKSR